MEIAMRTPERDEEPETMTSGRRMTNIVGVVSLVLMAGGCATVGGTKNFLTQAGFRQVPADTPQKLAHLQTLPEHRLIARTNLGHPYYVYADAGGCRCLYIGSPQQYQAYRRLVQEQRAEQGEAVEEARQWEIENAGMQ